ncbi:MAG TPA: hypothetical protein VH619_15360 [Verrucomicrobiae bacterium]|nr:hypothetical protein [Verrucomicrobiae bacterium]
MNPTETKSEFERLDAIPQPRPAQKLLKAGWWLIDSLDYLGGSRDTPPTGFPFRGNIWRGLWWGLLIGIILLFCGQTSKFIYIDF